MEIPREELRAEIKADDNALAMYRGIVRFLVEDQWNSAYEGTRSALQRECRARAYGVVGRSRSSVNGGQGLNTGLADAFNLMWKIGMVAGSGLPTEILRTYEQERKPVALNVVQASGALVRATKYSDNGTHAVDYVKIVERRAGYITGMGIRYGDEGPVGSRFFDFRVRNHDEQESRREWMRQWRLSTMDIAFVSCEDRRDAGVVSTRGGGTATPPSPVCRRGCGRRPNGGRGRSR
ncbi:L-tyrosine/L-tryptophan isonitrile synthase family protein [Allokutzneria sp. A3M-2-11 16]|uniref:L-tyrosine/L-tryptophan isonitrile synthase family protein n=1 Tax=Allokutzneria sp. A3M-2-11 16 TaxID=2962043 RepID=UPI0020B8C58D|nr:L-tyrosine/L-tryptophan isonitrile synthase family protein [Allokutzneria sp. A3M-2-11 16]MCP3803410.1 L-tyrosine/L-tryptophan isonitrile synthase family protein [Allokutzneria sp. A3M-2-11 16]